MDSIVDNAQPIRFYRPDYHIKTPEMRSPEYVQMSTAAAITLGLIPGKMHRTACTHCLNLLVTYPEGCRANCAYCGLARHREEARDYADRNFIRVDWPTARYNEVIERVKAGSDRGQFERTRGKGVDSPHKFEHYWRAIEWAAEVYGPEKFGAHLICGMGETEREILEVAQRIRDMGGHNHMFAFFPERGSLMEDWPAADRGQGRGVQPP